MLKRLLLITLALILSGCGTKTIIEKVPVHVWATPSDELITNCKVSDFPVELEEFLNMTDEQKEKVSFNYIGSLIGNVIVCNKTIDSIRAWKVEKLSENKEALK